MARVSYTSLGTSPFRKMLGHNPQLLEAFTIIDKTISEKLTLPPELREEVRRHLAYGNGCRY